MRTQHPALADKEHLKSLNGLPKDTFKHTSERWNDGDAEKKAIALYQAWLKSLKPGDMVYYDYWSGWHGGRTITTVKNITKTGMIRLADDKLVETDGRVKGERRYLQPYTEAYEHHKKRLKAIYELSCMKYEHFTDEGLALIIQAIGQAESLLPKMLEDGK